MATGRYRVWKRGRLVQSSRPGVFAGVRTQKIFGQLDCWSGKRAKPENRIFFLTWKDAVDAGYRPCGHCKPAPDLTLGESLAGNLPRFSRKVFIRGRRRKKRRRP